MRYEAKPYEDRSVGTIAQLLLQSGQLQADQQERLAAIAANAELQRGQAAAQAAQATGQAWSGGLGAIAQLASSVPGIIEARKRTALAQQEMALRTQKAGVEMDEVNRVKADRAAMDQAQSPVWGKATNPTGDDPGPVVPMGANEMGPPQFSADPTPDQVEARLPGHLRGLYRDQLTKSAQAQASLEESQQKIEQFKVNARGHAAAGVIEAGYTLPAFSTALETLQSMRAITPQERTALMTSLQELPEEQTKDIIKHVTDNYFSASPEAQKAYKERQPTFDSRSPESDIFNKQTGEVTTYGTPKETQPTLASLALKAAQGDKQAGAALRLMRPPSTTAADSAQSRADIADAVQGMIDGNVPPLLPGRASTAYTAMLAEAQRRGYNLAGAATDWMATQKHIATMNGSQQLRLNQAINALPELLDSVESLAKQWDAGPFPILNKANMVAATNGAYGKDAAIIANKLKTQIADVVGDLGSVYMGGNSPTDHAMKLAETALNENWDHDVLISMVQQAKGNVRIRKNSINNTGVAGASADNPYMPAAPAQAPPPPPAPVSVTSPSGQVFYYQTKAQADAAVAKAKAAGLWK